MLCCYKTQQSKFVFYHFTYAKCCRLLQAPDDLDRSSDIHPVLKGKDENSHHKKTSKDDLLAKENKTETMALIKLSC